MNIDYENKVKSLAEICIIDCINNKNFVDELNKLGNLKLVSRGGDALNYYFNDVTPTHDWDFGLMTIIPNDLVLTQDEFDKQADIVQNIGDYFASNLSSFFATAVIHPSFKDLHFYFRWDNARLSSVSFNYSTGFNTYISNAVIDIYMFDDTYTGVVNKLVTPNQYVTKIKHWINKIKQTDNITNDIYRQDLPQHDAIFKKTLFSNKIDTVVQDDTTGMVYISPGDLFNDTMRMVYSGIYDIDVSYGNNKLAKYAKKLSKLLDLFNGVGICPDKTCKYDITKRILSRNTNNKDCMGKEIKNIKKFKKSCFRKLNKKYLNIVYTDLDKISTKKLCEMLTVLGYYL